jgi:ABC-type Fe3+/spermidine/putrescine transport system ATPase subunit
MTRVSLNHLTKTYSGAQPAAVNDLSLEIPQGEVTALLGPSGCGKTTTMKMIAGLTAPTSGDIAFDGVSVLQVKPENRSAVMVFQDHLLFPYMSVAENIGFGLKMRYEAKPKVALRVAEMLELVQLPGLGQRRPSELSGGQQQRVALARALILRPKVLLLDEPLSNLDAHLRFEMRDLIRSLQKELGLTTIFVTHDQEEAVVLADRIALILEGKLRQFDRPEVFFKCPVDEAAARFFGGRNFVPGISDGAVFNSALGALRLPQGVLAGPGTLTFRPENVRLAQSPENCILARLVNCLYMGTQTQLRLTVGDVTIEAVVSPGVAEGLRAGMQLPITLPQDALWVLR